MVAFFWVRSAAESPARFQRRRLILSTNLAASRLFEMLRVYIVIHYRNAPLSSKWIVHSNTTFHTDTFGYICFKVSDEQGKCMKWIISTSCRLISCFTSVCYLTRRIKCWEILEGGSGRHVGINTLMNKCDMLITSSLESVNICLFHVHI